MKNKYIVIFIIMTVLQVNAQPVVQWQKFFKGSKEDVATSICHTSDGGFLILGNSCSSDGDFSGFFGENFDIWLIKISSAGSLIWEKEIGGYGTDMGFSIQETRDSGCIIAGYTNSTRGMVETIHGRDDFCMIKLTKSGIIQWDKSFGGKGNDVAYSIKQTTDDGFIVVGTTYSNDGDFTNHGLSDILVIKTSNLGAVQWQKTFGGSEIDESFDIQLTNDGGYIIVGNTNSNDGDVSINHGHDDIWVIKLNDKGNLEWQKILGGSLKDRAYAIEKTNDGGYIIAGETCSQDGDLQTRLISIKDIWVIKLSKHGLIEWQKVIDNYSMGLAKSVKQNKNGEFIIAGKINSTNKSSPNKISEKITLFKFSKKGDLIWEGTLPGNSDANSALLIDEGSFIVVGKFTSEDNDIQWLDNNLYDFLIVKLTEKK